MFSRTPPTTDSLSLHSASSSSSSHPPPSPTKRRVQPAGLRIDTIGVDPSVIIGKTLTRVRRSPTHPALTLDFSDNTTFQILVDGYDPIHKGIPKDLEMDEGLASVIRDCVNSDDGYGGRLPRELTIVDCTFVKLTDKAFKRSEPEDGEIDAIFGVGVGKESRWNQNHLAIALKFSSDEGQPPPRWHCVWATLADYDSDIGLCTFRSYDDVYLNELQRSPQKRKPKKKKSRMDEY
ncbi:hypothetical protein JAAARDRAFT_39136 [Jaapia argillacea MUCL 33604]|uniref:Uncharacterized protein n=1 Tax=Jaapia argillacea MUCL 33604 TaxID=933084 RepID=A0A067PQ77_9AGAM|nr:hypothetical protein JAAARDRAFT_39136 [Jaapia argillacea MUCL 33604]